MVRKDWLRLMLQIADPVLNALAEGRLHEKLPVEKPDRAMYAMLEAFGRTVTGIAPWLALEGLTGEEAALQARYRALLGRCMDAAVSPDSPDRMNFTEGYGQALVDTAFLAHGILRAPGTPVCRPGAPGKALPGGRPEGHQALRALPFQLALLLRHGGGGAVRYGRGI